MQLISRLIRIALEEASSHCLIAWHPDDDAPESFEAECEMDYVQSTPGIDGDYRLILNDRLFCLVDAASLECWHSSKILSECESEPV